jgi:hypothetical protein
VWGGGPVQSAGSGVKVEKPRRSSSPHRCHRSETTTLFSRIPTMLSVVITGDVDF